MYMIKLVSCYAKRKAMISELETIAKSMRYIYINKRTNVNLVRDCSQRWLDFQLWFLRTLIEYILPLNHWTLFFAKLFNYYGNNQKTGRLLPGVAMFHVFYSYLMKRMRTVRIVNLYETHPRVTGLAYEMRPHRRTRITGRSDACG